MEMKEESNKAQKAEKDGEKGYYCVVLVSFYKYIFYHKLEMRSQSVRQVQREGILEF